jgi:hypothetical protein
MKKYVWVYDPQSGGVTIPKKQFDEIKSRIILHMEEIAPNIVMDIKLKSQFCYVNTVEDGHIMPVCRMRHFDIDRWSFAFYTYGNETYQPCLPLSGKDNATIEEILDSCTMYF